jgi:hypothetical protein
MIIHCPGCGFLYIVEDGCSTCLTGKYSPKEANDQEDKASDTRKVENPAGDYMQPPAGQLSLMF